MIDDLDRTIEGLLSRMLPPSLTSQVGISFATPDDQFPPAAVTLPAIDLFLYDLRENRELRSNEWTIDRSNGTATRQRPPVRVDCSYLITAWPSAATPNPALDEHHMLGEVAKVLVRFPILPASALQGALQGQEPPLPTAILQPSNLQSMGEFWQAMGGKPKVALNYKVTIGIEGGEAEEIGPPVTDKRLRFAQGVGGA